MNNKISNKDLVSFLKQQNSSANFIDKLKIVYRPYICPFNELLNLIPENESVFDVGCGSGQFCLLVNQFRKPSKIAGIEISERIINNANRLFEGQTVPYYFMKYNGMDIPEELSDYKYIVLIDVLHHVPKENQLSFIDAIISRMSLESTLIIKDIEAGNPLVVLNKLHDLILSKEIGHELKSSFVIDHLDEKLEIVYFNKITTYVYPHYTIVATKS